MPDDNLTHEQASELYDRISHKAAARNSRARRYRVATAVIVILIAGFAGFSAYFGTSSGGSRASDSARLDRRFGVSLGPWKPHITAFGYSDAKAVSLAEAKAQAAFPVLAPSADAVSSAVPDLTAGAPAAEPAATGTPADSAVRIVWLDHRGVFADGSTGDMVAIEYNHLEIREEQMNSDYDGPSHYRGMVDQRADPNAYLGTVQGSTAYIVPPNHEQGMEHPGGVIFMRGNVQIRVEGYYPAADLVAIARSLS
jgi:hypothetical protein